MSWLGLDIGGANLKIASTQGHARSLPYLLWKNPNELAAALRQLICEAPAADGIATTMTGELADCFETKREGVSHILKAVEGAAAGRQVYVYQVNGEFASVESARIEPILSAASNWHALARFSSRFVSDFPSVLIDVGSTTTDIIPISRDGPLTESKTDTDRLLRGELVYEGIGRTPIAAITPVLPYRNNLCPVAAEFFATTADAAVLLGYMPEQPTVCDTADGRPLTKCYCRDRLARMLCADREIFDDRDAMQAAQFIWNQLAQRISNALRQVASALPTRVKSVLLCGSGESLATEAVHLSELSAPALSLSELLGAELSNVAPAYAVAVLANEWSEQR
jgi:probable H4MPT-linked C1 transfer pathway protein